MYLPESIFDNKLRQPRELESELGIVLCLPRLETGVLQHKHLARHQIVHHPLYARADHVAGLPGVLHGRTVGAIQTTSLPDPPDERAMVLRRSASARIPLLPPVPGERRRIGPLSWDVLGPPGTWDKAQKAVGRFLEGRVGLAPSSYTLGNASGLHDVNRMTPRQLVQVLEYMWHQPALGPEYIASMAVASGSGTLSDRMRDSDATGLLRAKTGTLSIASALVAAVGFLIADQVPDQGFMVEAFAAGAVLTMLADSMMPESFEHGGKTVGLLTVLGFFVAATLTVLQG